MVEADGADWVKALPAHREPVLEHVAVHQAGGVTVRPKPPAARWSLRLGPGVAEAVGAVAGLSLTGGINSHVLAGDRIAARLGPDEWLVIVPEAEAADAAAALGEALAGHLHSLVDVGHRDAGIGVEGARAEVALNAGVALDLDERAFPVGMATRTLCGKADIVLFRLGRDAWRVECWRSFAPYVHGLLVEATFGV